MSSISLIVSPYEPVIEYTPIAAEKIKHLVAKCDKEVGWFGSVSSFKSGNYYHFLIEDIFVPVQDVTATETDVDAKDLIALYEEIEGSGIDLSTVFYWGHSHVHMQPNPSGQDESQLLEYSEAYPIFIRGIYNKAGNERVDLFDFESNIRFDKIEASVSLPVMEKNEIEALDKLIKDRVSSRVYTPAATVWPKGRKYSPVDYTESDLWPDDYGSFSMDGVKRSVKNMHDKVFKPSKSIKSLSTRILK